MSSTVLRLLVYSLTVGFCTISQQFQLVASKLSLYKRSIFQVEWLTATLILCISHCSEWDSVSSRVFYSAVSTTRRFLFGSNSNIVQTPILHPVLWQFCLVNLSEYAKDNIRSRIASMVQSASIPDNDLMKDDNKHWKDWKTITTLYTTSWQRACHCCYGRTDYFDKMDALVKDRQTYEKLNHNLTPALHGKLSS